MNYCPHCGARLTPSARFCSNCGKPCDEPDLRRAPQQTPQQVPPRQRTPQQGYSPGQRPPQHSRPPQERSSGGLWKFFAGTAIGVFLSRLFGGSSSHSGASGHPAADHIHDTVLYTPGDEVGYGYDGTETGSRWGRDDDGSYGGDRDDFDNDFNDHDDYGTDDDYDNDGDNDDYDYDDEDAYDDDDDDYDDDFDDDGGYDTDYDDDDGYDDYDDD